MRVPFYMVAALCLVATCSEAPTGPSAPASISLISGGPLQGKAGATLAPIVVEVDDAGGTGLAGIEISLTPPTGGAVNPATATTGADGRASVILTLGSTAGAQIFVATAQGVSVQIPATATPDDPSAIAIVAGNTQSDTIHTVLAPLRVRVTDRFGNRVGAATVDWTRASGTGALASTTSTTDASGDATNTYTLGTVPGPETASATIGDASVTFTFTTTPGAPASITAVSGSGQTAQVGVALAAPMTVRVTDTPGNPVGNATVTWTATNGAIVATTTTGVDGLATATLTGGTSIGAATATARIANGQTASFTATITVGAASQLAFATQPGNGIPNATLPTVSIALRDAGGNGTTATNAVTVALGNAAGAVLTGTLTRSAVNGVAAFDDLKVDKVGTGYTLVATSGSLPSATSASFSTALGAASAIAITAGNGQSATVNTAVAAAPSARVTDAAGNPVPGVVVTFAASGGSTSPADGKVTTNASGIATLTSWTLGTTPGAFTLTTSAPGTNTVVFTATATVGAAASIAVSAGQGQSATVNSAVAVAPAARVTDAFGNAVAGVVVTFTPSAGATSPVDGKVTTNTSGVATLTSWTLGATAGAQSLVASAPGTGNATFNATAVAAAAATLAIEAGDNQSATVNATVLTPPAVKVTDASGNPVAGVVVTFAPSAGTTNPADGKVTTNANGIAALLSWRVGTTAGAQTLVASATGLTSVSFHATALTGAAANLAVTAGDNQTATVNTAVATAPSATVTDAYGNPVAGVEVTFTPSATASTSPADGKVITNASGVATLTSWTLGATAGAEALVVSAPLTVDVTIHATAVAGSAANLVIAAGDNQSATVDATVATPPSAKVTDASGNAIAGAVVTFAPSGGTTNPADGKVTTDANGVATLVSWRVGTAAGAQTLVASAPGLTSVTFHATALAGAAANLAIGAGDNQTATVNTAVATAPSATVTDAFGNPVAGAVVTFAAGAGATSPADGKVTTNASGVATLTSWTLGTAAGAQSVAASSPGTSGVTFNATATAGAVDHLLTSTAAILASDAGSGITTFPQSIAVTVVDAYDNPIGSAAVSWATSACGAGFSAGTSTTSNSSGVAASPSVTVPNGTPGSCRLTASLSGGSPKVFYLIMKPAGSSAWTNASGDGVFATAGNWTGGAPSAATALFIPAAMTASPQLSANAAAASVVVESNATNAINLGTNTLTVGGNVEAGAGGITNGTLTVDATAATTISGKLPATVIGNTTSCPATYSLTAATSATSITLDCSLDVGANTLTVSGNFSTAGAGGLLKMTTAGGAVDVTGASSFAGASETGSLTNGTFTARGGFSQLSTVSTSSFAASGSHKTAFPSTSASSVSFADAASSFFNDLDVTGSGTVTFSTSATVAGALTAGANATLVASDKRIEVAGAVTAASTSDLGGVDSLRVTGTTFPAYSNTTAGKAPDVTVITNTVTLPANRTVAGGLSVTGTLNLGGRTLTVLDSVVITGTLQMPVSLANVLTVRHLKVGTGGLFTAVAGTLNVSGDFTEAGTSTTSFAPSAGFLTTLNGTGAQSVSFAHPGVSSSYFRNLTIQNTSASGVTFSTNGLVRGALIVDNNAVLKTLSGITLTAADTVAGRSGSKLADVAELVVSGTKFPGFAGASTPATVRLTSTMTMGTDVTLTGGLIVEGLMTVGGHKLFVAGDFTVQGASGLFRVNSAADSIVVNGNAEFKGADMDVSGVVVSAGAFDFRGNFKVSGTNAFYVGSSSANTVYFKGTTQTVDIGGTGNALANVTVGPNNGNLTFTTDATLTGRMAIRTNGVVTVNATKTLTLSSATPALDFHDGSVMHVNGTVLPTTPSCRYDNTGATPPAMDGSGIFADGAATTAAITSTCDPATLPLALLRWSPVSLGRR